MSAFFTKVRKGFCHPDMVWDKFYHAILLILIKDDERYVKWDYFLGMGKFPNLECPKTYNEKLCWLKLHAKNPAYSRMVDKYEAKEYVKSIVGEEYIIPSYGVWNKFEDIDFDSIPNQFVLKTTHDSGWVIICKNKETFNVKQAQSKVSESYRKNLYLYHREYPYKDVKPRIIIEKLMCDTKGQGLKDYKFFCFDGVVKMLFVATDRPVDTRFDFFDRDFNHLPFRQGHPMASKTIEKPENFEEMVRIAEKLSKNIPHVRVDLYNIDGKIFFGELTFFHFGGTVPFKPGEWDSKIGEWLILPQNNE